MNRKHAVLAASMAGLALVLPLDPAAATEDAPRGGFHGRGDVRGGQPPAALHAPVQAMPQTPVPAMRQAPVQPMPFTAPAAPQVRSLPPDRRPEMRQGEMRQGEMRQGEMREHEWQRPEWRDHEAREHEWREHEAEEARERAWREHEWREHEIREREFERFNDFDRQVWLSGGWDQGWHGGRYGWWWFAGGRWYLYDAPIYPYPTYVPEVVYVEPAPRVVEAPPPPPPSPPPAQYWYYCTNPQGYYPYVAHCSVPWRAVPVKPPGG